MLLLDATGSYHREVARQMSEGIHFTTPLMRLQDPVDTKVIIVTLAEQTPVLEAAALQADLQRAHIQPWAWVINNSLAAAEPTSPLLQRRADAERAQIDIVTHDYALRHAVVPMLAVEPVGIPALASLGLARAAALTGGTESI
jgi:arsenite-transporting ATPase